MSGGGSYGGVICLLHLKVLTQSKSIDDDDEEGEGKEEQEEQEQEGFDTNVCG